MQVRKITAQKDIITTFFFFLLFVNYISSFLITVIKYTLTACHFHAEALSQFLLSHE